MTDGAEELTIQLLRRQVDDLKHQIRNLKDCLQDALAAETMAHPRTALAPWTDRARELIFGRD